MAKTVVQGEIAQAKFSVESDWELRQFGVEINELLREEKQLRLALFLAEDAYAYAQGTYDTETQKGFRELAELIRLRKRWAGQISSQRYNDMAFRIHQNQALHQYRRQFDLAQTYTYLTAAAYDYETNLSSDDPKAGDRFLRQIVGVRSLGEIIRFSHPDDGRIVPVPGEGGLAEPMGQMKDNFAVLKGQIGFNNPQKEANQFSLRHGLFRLGPASDAASDAAWRQTLQSYYTPNIYSVDAVARLAKHPYGTTAAQPGLVIPFPSTMALGRNFFNHPLDAGDSAYADDQFSTKIASVGIWLENYNQSRLVKTPRVYLIPAGRDVLRPRNSNGQLRYWNVQEQQIPMPYAVGEADLANPSWIPRIDGLSGELFAVKPYAKMRAFPLTSAQVTQMQSFPMSTDQRPSPLVLDTRLIGRSVWNTQWLLVIPGSTLLGDPEQGLDDFIEHVDDIHLYIQTYSYQGTR